MIDTAKIKKYLRQELSPKRYKHSVNVSKTAVELAAKYGCDLHKAEIAGLIHDCTREMALETQREYIKAMNFEPEDMLMPVKELLHSASAVYVCKELFLIEDEDILMAVRYHTTGREKMSALEKIIFLADFVEPSRSFSGVEEIRERAYKNLDEAIIKAMNSTIRHLLDKNQHIHPRTIAARNYLLTNT